MARLRVLNVITGLNAGGAEQTLITLLGALDRDRFDLGVVSLLANCTLAPAVRALGVPLWELGVARGPDPRGAVRLARVLGEFRPDVLQTWMYHADLVGLLVGRVRRVPRIFWNIRCSDVDVRHYRPLLRATIAACSSLSRFPDGILVNSQRGQEVHSALGYRNRSWHVVPNGIDCDRFRRSAEARADVRRGLGLGDELLVGHVARFDPMKDHANFLQAAGRVAKALPRTHFLLVGRGVPEDAGLRSLVAELGLADRVHMVGERKDVERWLSACDVAVMSSAFGEGFPNVVAEAMACEVPPVVTDVGDAAVIVGDLGPVVPPRNPEALGAAIAGVLSQPATMRADLGRRARTRIADHFSLARMVKSYADIYEQV